MKTSSSFSSSSSSSKGNICSRTRTRTRTRRRTRRILPIGAFAVLLLAALGAAAQTTNGLSDKEIQGRQLVEKLLAEQPAENFTNTGVLEIRADKGSKSNFTFQCQVVVSASNWSIHYLTPTNSFPPASNAIIAVISHTTGQPNSYYLHEGFCGLVLSNTQTAIPFASSDFWICDLGLEFLHWPAQKILKGDTARGRLCKVLESTNPDPSTNGYSRVLSWIDNETLGILKAEAYDAKGKLLKEFLPKDIKKVNGQWQVQSMEIRNVQTKSRTQLVLDSKAK